MNRPKISDYEKQREGEPIGFIEVDYVSYYHDLEKYCDELEKALDKAFEELAKGTPGRIYLYGGSKDDYKEMFLKDE